VSSVIAEVMAACDDIQDEAVGEATRPHGKRHVETEMKPNDPMPGAAAPRGVTRSSRQTGFRPASLARREMMIVSKAYYVEHKSKIEIAEELGISRFRVARLLAQAEEVGVVTHTLNSGGMIEELSEAVSHHLNIPNANVLEVYGDVPSVRTAVGRAIGLYVRDMIEEGEVLGIGWGRTLNAMFDDLDEMPNVEIRLLTGRNAGDTGNSARRLLRRALALTGGPGYFFPAPFFIDDARTASALRRQPNVASTLAGFSRVTTAVVTIGVIGPRPIGVAYSTLPVHFSEQLMLAGGIAELCGFALGEDGHVVDARLGRHCLSISAHQLGRVPRVIAAVSDPAKAPAVRAACMSGLVKDLVIDVELAQALLRLPRVRPDDLD
jgi:DNA-binding transcriptional regulator LsrR (DeoR family)